MLASTKLLIKKQTVRYFMEHKGSFCSVLFEMSIRRASMENCNLQVQCHWLTASLTDSTFE